MSLAHSSLANIFSYRARNMMGGGGAGGAGGANRDQ